MSSFPASYINESRELLQTLGEEGAGFTLVHAPGAEMFDSTIKDYRPATGKEPIGKGWQTNPYDLFAATTRVSNHNGNVGVLCGHARFYMLDFDSGWEQAVAKYPWLEDSIVVFRENAPDRAKVIFRLPEGQSLPSRKKSGVIEVLGRGNQGVVAGVHNTGAFILHRGSTIQEWDEKIIRDLWLHIAGEPLGVDNRSLDDKYASAHGVDMSRKIVHRTVAHPDVAERRAREYVEKNFKPYVRRVALAEVINEKDQSQDDWSFFVEAARCGLTEDAALLLYENLPIGSSSKYARTGRIGYLERTIKNAYLRVDRTQFHLQDARTVLRTRIYERITSGWTTRRAKSMFKVAHALLNKMQERSSLSVDMGMRPLAVAAGLGCHKTATTALENLFPLFIAEELISAKGQQYYRVRLNVELLMSVEIPRITQVEGVQYGEVRGESATLEQLMASPVTDTPVSSVVKEHATLEARRTGEVAKDLMRRMFMKSLSYTDSAVFEALQENTAGMTTAEVAEYTELNPATCSTSLRRLLDYGYVEREKEGRSYLYEATTDTKRLIEVDVNMFLSFMGREHREGLMLAERLYRMKLDLQEAELGTDEGEINRLRKAVMWLEERMAKMTSELTKGMDDEQADEYARQKQVDVKQIIRNRAIMKNTMKKPALQQLGRDLLGMLQDGMNCDEVKALAAMADWTAWDLDTAMDWASREYKRLKGARYGGGAIVGRGLQGAWPQGSQSPQGSWSPAD